jgi:ribosomal protein S18 acetylase RimI-like enzyme
VLKIAISEWAPPDATEGLAELLRAVVAAGASVSFVMPFSLEEARAFWTGKVEPGVRGGTRRVLVARQGERVVGTVQLDMGTPPNQQHRADVAKLLVHPDARRQGIARMLMERIEEIARAESRLLLTLDTVRGNSAEALYRSMDYQVAGIIPGYARSALTPELEDTVLFWKKLALETRVKMRD